MESGKYEEEPLDKAAEMAARTIRAAGHVKEMLGTASNVKAAAIIGSPYAAVVAAMISDQRFWKAVGGIAAGIFLFMYMVVNSVSIIFSYLGFADADEYVMNARAEECRNIKLRIESLFAENPEIEGRIMSSIGVIHDAALDEIGMDYSDNWSDCDDYEVSDEADVMFYPNMCQYLAVLAEESWNGRQIVAFQGYSWSEENSGQTEGWLRRLINRPNEAQAEEMLSELIEIHKEDFFAWDCLGTHEVFVDKPEGEEDIILEIVDYQVYLKLNPTLTGTVPGYSFRYVTDDAIFESVLHLFDILQASKTEVNDMLHKASSWKNYVLGAGASEDIADGTLQTSGDVLTYETVGQCLKRVIYFNQEEEPWASLPYGSSCIKDSGCGPTALAIIISSLTDSIVTPQMTASYAMERGMYVPGKGTSHAFPQKAAEEWGLNVERVRREEISHVVDELKAGALAVVICAENTISGSSGHYIVLTGVDAGGYITIADPGSRIRTGKVYSQSTIQSYARNLTEGSIWIISE